LYLFNDSVEKMPRENRRKVLFVGLDRVDCGRVDVRCRMEPSSGRTTIVPRELTPKEAGLADSVTQPHGIALVRH